MQKFLFLFLIICSHTSKANTYYTSSPAATLDINGGTSLNWTSLPSGGGILGNYSILATDNIVLLPGANVNVPYDAQIASIAINGDATLTSAGATLQVKFGTILNEGILTLNNIKLQFGSGDNSTTAGKILGTPNGTTTGINASAANVQLIFRGGAFTTYAAANAIVIPAGTFINNTVSKVEINTYSLFGPQQVELNTGLTITNELLLTNGVIKTPADVTKKLLIGVNGSAYGSYNSQTNYGYVLGTLYANTNNDNKIYEFPVAASPTAFISVGITPTSNTATTFSVTVNDFGLAEDNPLTTQPKCVGSNFLAVQSGLQYNINRVSGTASATVRLYYYQKPYYYWSGLVAPTIAHRIVMAHYNTTANCWERVSSQSQSGDVGAVKITSDVLSNFSPFTFGYGIATTILPLQNLQFTALAKNGYNSLQWHTENETNTKHFEIEYSTNGNYFFSIGKEDAKNLGVNNYAFSHNISIGGGDVMYYRLKIIDNDGSYKYSKIVKIIAVKNKAITIYPNPAQDYITLNNITANSKVQIINSMGEVVLQRNVVSGGERVSVQNLRKGVYVVKIIGETTLYKLIKD